MKIDSSPKFYGNPLFLSINIFNTFETIDNFFFCHLFVRPMHSIGIIRTLVGQSKSAYKLRKLHKSKTFYFNLSLFRYWLFLNNILLNGKPNPYLCYPYPVINIRIMSNRKQKSNVWFRR